MDLGQIALFIVGLILMFSSGAIGHLIRSGRGAPRPLGTGVKNLALAKLNITWLDIIYAMAMIIGILAKEVWDSINETGTISIKVPRLIAAIIISPIIYAAVYSKFVQDELSLPGIAMAFQNGFFWQAVFRTVQGGG